MQYDPPGEARLQREESWTKLGTHEYFDAATELDKAAQAKERTPRKAHGMLANSCMSCHREHRMMGPGRGWAPGADGPTRIPHAWPTATLVAHLVLLALPPGGLRWPLDVALAIPVAHPLVVLLPVALPSASAPK